MEAGMMEAARLRRQMAEDRGGRRRRQMMKKRKRRSTAQVQRTAAGADAAHQQLMMVIHRIRHGNKIRADRVHHLLGWRGGGAVAHLTATAVAAGPLSPPSPLATAVVVVLASDVIIGFVVGGEGRGGSGGQILRLVSAQLLAGFFS